MPTTPPSPTYTLKGFISIGAWSNNSPNLVANLGELSVLSQTYAKDRQLFGGSTGTGTPSSVNLTVFASEGADGSAVDVPSDYVASILSYASWVYTQATAGQLSADANAFSQALNTFAAGAIGSITVGTMTSHETLANTWAPAYVEFYFTAASTSNPSYTTNSRIKLWFSDAAFQTEYDEFSIVFVPPLTPIDTFFLGASQIQTALNARSLTDIMKDIATARGTNPETVLDSALYDWIDPSNSANVIPTNWTYLIYGAAGNNVDSIRDALRTYILANSQHTADQWKAIFPDIFAATEFILTPMWSQVAIPNQTLAAGMYSPTVNAAQAANLAVETANGEGYDASFVQNTVNVIPVPFKSMSLLAIGSQSNRGGVYEFVHRWPDYIDVSSTSLDFDRMSASTQGFAVLLEQMLNVAEAMTLSTDIPVGMSRVQRNDTHGDPVLYLTANYEMVDYLVVAKSWMLGKYGQTTDTEGSLAVVYNGAFANGAYQLLNQESLMTLQFAAVNATAPVTYSLIDTTVTGASLNASTGQFTGTFPAPGTYTVTVKIVDAVMRAMQRTFTFNYQQPSAQGGGTTPPLVLGAPTMPTGVVGQAYTGSIPISGGSSPYSLYGNQTLPAGMAVSVQGNLLIFGGTPTVAGQGTVIVTVQDSSGAGGGTAKMVSTQFNLTINAA